MHLGGAIVNMSSVSAFNYSSSHSVAYDLLPTKHCSADWWIIGVDKNRNLFQ